MASEVRTDPEQGTATLLKGIVNDIGDLIKQQFEFARAEIRSDLKKTREASSLLLVGAVLAGLGIVVLCLMLVYLLHWLTSPPEQDLASLPLWACHGIVGGLLLLAGLGVAWAGRDKFASFNPLPDQTAQTMKENLPWTKNANSS